MFDFLDKVRKDQPAQSLKRLAQYMGVEHREPSPAERPDQQEPTGHQGNSEESWKPRRWHAREARAREALIVFVAGTERTSARSKAFSNLVSEQEISDSPGFSGKIPSR